MTKIEKSLDIALLAIDSLLEKSAGDMSDLEYSLMQEFVSAARARHLKVDVSAGVSGHAQPYYGYTVDEIERAAQKGEIDRTGDLLEMAGALSLRRRGMRTP